MKPNGEAYLNHNGNLIPSQGWAINPLNRAFKYGDGFFESILCVNEELPFFSYHFSRIHKACGLLGIDPAPLADLQLLKNEILKTAEANGHYPHCRCRLTIYRSGSGKYAPIGNLPEFLIETERLEDLPALNPKGLTASIFTDIRKPPLPYLAIKSCNAQLYVLAARWARNQGYDEALLTDDDGNIIEATSSNLFCIKGDRIITPALSSGCVDGVMRRVIIGLLAQNGMVVQESMVSENTLLQADEIFITNAVIPVRWIGQIHSKSYSRSQTRLIFEKLVDAYFVP